MKNRTMKKLLIPFILLISLNCYSQENQWPGIPIFNESNLVLINQNTFIGVISAATLSFGLAQFVFKDTSHLNFYQARAGVFDTTRGKVIIRLFSLQKIKI